MLLQTAAAVAGSAAPHPLSGTAASWMWALPLLPLLGFVLNGLIAILGAARVGPADPSARGRPLMWPAVLIGSLLLQHFG